MIINKGLKNNRIINTFLFCFLSFDCKKFNPRDDFAAIASHGRGVRVLDVRFVREIAEMDSEADCRILEIEDCRLPRGIEYWYRQSAKEMSAPFYLMTVGEV